MHLSKLRGCATPTVNRNVSYGLRASVMCRPRFTACDNCDAQEGDAGDGAGCAYAGEGPCGKHTCVHLRFAVNLKLFFESF